jgi:hypothetical protein
VTSFVDMTSFPACLTIGSGVHDRYNDEYSLIDGGVHVVDGSILADF